MTIQNLYNKVKHGDANAFKELFNQLYPSMCVIARRYVDDTLAEDIAQDAFVKLWNERETLLDIQSIKSYLYVSVKNLCLNHLRRNTVEDKYTSSIDQEDFFQFNNRVMEEETYRILQQAIDKLPEQRRKIMLLTLQGVKNQEIAERLGISVNTVKTLKYKSLKLLKESLKDYFYILLLIG